MSLETERSNSTHVTSGRIGIRVREIGGTGRVSKSLWALLVTILTLPLLGILAWLLQSAVMRGTSVLLLAIGLTLNALASGAVIGLVRRERGEPPGQWSTWSNTKLWGVWGISQCATALALLAALVRLS